MAKGKYREKGKGEHQALLKDPDIKRWYENVARGAITTADVYLRGLGNFCQNVRKQPKDLLKLNEQDLYNLLMDYVSSMERQKYAGSYVESRLKNVKSWLSHHGIEVKRKIKVKGADETPSLKEERVPTQKELVKILSFADPKVKTTASLVCFAGLRLESIGNYDGSDGLRVMDIPELEIKGSEVNFTVIPARVIVRSQLSKARHQYFSFLNEEACEYLKDYLESRLRGNGTSKFDPESPLIKAKSPTFKAADRPFIRSNNIGDALRGPIREAGFSWRPYVLRSYFDTEMMLAESKGLILRDYRVFFMGHKGDIEARYTTNKHKLPESVIEDMRASYAKASKEYLQTRVISSQQDVRGGFRAALLADLGYSEGEIAKLDLANITSKEFQELITKKYREMLTGNGSRQKVIPLNELENYILQGWEFATHIPNDKAIIKLPS